MARRFAFIGFLVFILSACQPTPLWGVPPLAPTSELPEPLLPLFVPSTSTPTPIVPTVTPTATPSPLIWIDPAMPPSLRKSVLAWNLPATEDKQAATAFLDLSDSAASKSQWIYALVAPFPTVTDGVTLYTLKDAWNDSSSGSFDTASINSAPQSGVNSDNCLPMLIT